MSGRKQIWRRVRIVAGAPGTSVGFISEEAQVLEGYAKNAKKAQAALDKLDREAFEQANPGAVGSLPAKTDEVP